MFKRKNCPDCEGRGYISHCEVYEEYGCHWDEHCKKCNGNDYIETSMTNADHIREMNDYELAEFLDDVYHDGFNDGLKNDEVNAAVSSDSLMSWLQEECNYNGGEENV